MVLFTLLVNAPTIRPLIRALGIDRMTEDERTELNRGLSAAWAQSQSVLGDLRAAELISEHAYEGIEGRISGALESEAAELDESRSLRRAHLQALQVEQGELDRIYSIGLIDEYTYLDLRTMVLRDRERWFDASADARARPDVSKPSPFLRVETAVIRRLREANWAAGLLALYQRTRITQRLQRDIAGVLACRAVVQALAEDPELAAEHREAVVRTYRERLARRQARIETIRSEFPAFFARFEERFFQRAALMSAAHEIEHAHHEAYLGAKAYVRIEHQIQDALARLPELPPAGTEVKLSELIQRVPLFNALSEELLEKLAKRARQVSFLPGDVIIGQDERGNALYIILHGEVVVLKRDAGGESRRLATLGTGDFFGETALLGDDVRTATVKAQRPVSLLRLTQRDVRSLAEEDPEFDRHLRSVSETRQQADTHA